MDVLPLLTLVAVNVLITSSTRGSSLIPTQCRVVDASFNLIFLEKNDTSLTLKSYSRS